MLKVRVGIPHARAAKCRLPFVSEGGRPLHSTQESQLAVEKRCLSINVPAAAPRVSLISLFNLGASVISELYVSFVSRAECVAPQTQM